MADKEYIERGTLLHEIDKCEPMNWTGSEAENQADDDHIFYRGLVATAPAADVVEVRHGEWVYDPDGTDWGLGAWRCSLCSAKNDNLGMGVT